MSKKTILHLTGMHSLKYGGVERYLLELAKSSIRRGHRTVIQYESRPHSEAYMQELERAGCETVILRLGSNGLRSALKLNHVLRIMKPAIVLTHFVRGYIQLLLPFMRRKHGIKRLLALVHSVQDHKRSWRRIAFNRYDYVIGVSKGVADSLIAIGTRPEIVRTHYLGLFKERTRMKGEGGQFRNELGIPADAIVIGCMAFDSKVKGIDILLEALAKITNYCPAIHLLIIGIDPGCSNLPDEAERLGIGSHTHWAGLRDEGWRLLNAADLYAQPSRSEAMPFAVMEAMELGLLVLATDVGGLPEIVADGETGYLAKPDSAHFAEVIKRAIDTRQSWATMGAAGQARYRRLFKGEPSVESLIDTYFCSEKASPQK